VPKSNTGSHFKLYSVALAGIPSGVSSQKHNIITTSCPHCSDNQHTWNQASKTICIKSAFASAPSLKGGFYTWFWNPLQYTVPWTQTSPKRAYDQVKLFLQSALGCAQHTHTNTSKHMFQRENWTLQTNIIICIWHQIMKQLNYIFTVSIKNPQVKLRGCYCTILHALDSAF